MKTCSRCKVPKNKINFHSTSTSKDGLYCYCKQCHAEYERLRRWENGAKPKRLRQNRNGLLECLICFDFLSFDCFTNSKRGSFGKSAYCKKCRNKVKFKSDSKEEQLRRREIYKKDGRYRNRILTQKLKRQSAINSAKDGTVTNEFVRITLNKRKCHYCKKFIKRDNRSLDHVIPLTKEGKHSASNIVMACISCNLRKNSLSAEEFMKKLETVYQLDAKS